MQSIHFKQRGRDLNLVERVKGIGRGVIIGGIVSSVLIIGYGLTPGSNNLGRYLDSEVNEIDRVHPTELSYQFISQYKENIINISEELNVPPQLVAGILISENYARPKLEDWKDRTLLLWNKGPGRFVFCRDPSLGACQINESTALTLSRLYDDEPKTKEELRGLLQDPVQNIFYAARYIHYLINRPNRQTTEDSILSDPKLLAIIGTEYVRGETDSNREDAKPYLQGGSFLVAMCETPFEKLLGEQFGITETQIASYYGYITQNQDLFTR